MKTVYYAPCVPPELYGNDFMLYQEPDSLYKDIIKDKNRSNDYNNYLDCPAVIKSMQNTFIVRNPWTSTIKVDYHRGVFSNEHGVEDSIAEHFSPKPNSRTRPMFNVYHNYLFFCDDDLEITTTPAYMHTSEYQTKCMYIPGTFNISKWLRPVEGAFEMQMPFTELNLKHGDPMYYVKFNTTEAVKLVRFDLTPELWNMSQGCVHHKKYEPAKSLSYLYKLFVHTGMRRLISKKVKENLIE